MTLWGSSFIASLARDAGFKGDAVHDAVALAVAATQGADHYRHNPISWPGAERRGLWAIRVDEVPGDELVDLFNPSASARVAFALWQASSQSFGWHPTWISGAAANVRPSIVLHLSGQGRRGGPVATRGWPAHMARSVAWAEAMQRTAETGRFPGE
jgi:hypothetical protein